MAEVNMISIMKKLVKGAAVNKKVEKAVLAEALVVFTEKKDDLIDNFNKHKVTVELEGDLDVKSNFLPRGNLFSFIGFFQGSKPTEPIRDLLKEIRLLTFPRRKILKKSSVMMEYTVNVPDLRTFWSATPYPDNWSSGSFLRDLEHQGISGFEYYVFSRAFQGVASSRSGRGLQKEDDITNAFDLGPIDYLEALLNDFKKKVSRRV